MKPQSPEGYSGRRSTDDSSTSHSEVYGEYRDASDEPCLVLSSVLFFDLLGVRSIASGAEAQRTLGPLRNALADAIARSQIDHPWSRYVSTWFTDNAVVAQPLVIPHQSEGLIGTLEIIAADLMVHCWRHGFLGRGAITYGEHYMDERFVYGPALIEGVELEKKTKWPRIALGESAVEAEAQHSTYYSHPLQSAQSRCLTTDETGVVFVDHLGIFISNCEGRVPDKFLRDLKESTVKALSSLRENSDAWLKWRWAGEYQNHSIASRLVDPEPYLVPIPSVCHHFSDFLDTTPATAAGSPWYIMDRQDRISIGELGFPSFVPETPGVYALYRAGIRQYVGATKNLHTRLVRYHLGKSRTMRDSALRRNVAELLGFASASAIKEGRYLPTDDQVTQVQRWICGCAVAWKEHETRGEAMAFEARLKEQLLPKLTKL